MTGAPLSNRKILLVVATMACALVVALLIPYFLRFVASMGQDTVSSDLQMDYGLGCVWAVLLGFGLCLLPIAREEKRTLLILWGIKCFVTLGAMLLYEYYYDLDAYGYFIKGHYDMDLVAEFLSGNGTKVVTAVAHILIRYIPLLDTYQGLKVFFSIFGLFGSFLIYRSATLALGFSDLRMLYFVGLFPSVMFWGSTIGKDTLIFFFICLYAFGAVGWLKTKKLKYFVPVAIGVVLSSFIRLWLAPILLAPLAIQKLFERGNWLLKIIACTILFVALSVYAQRLLEALAVQTIDELVDRTNVLSRNWSMGGSSQTVPALTSLSAIIKFAPLGTFTALFRPLPGEIMNAFGLLAGFESLFVLFLVIYSVRLVRGRIWRDSLILWSFMTSFFWGIFYGFISYQNLGAGFRFRLQVMPFILFLSLYTFGLLLLSRERKDST